MTPYDSLIRWYWPFRHGHTYDRGTLRNVIISRRLTITAQKRRGERS